VSDDKLKVLTGDFSKDEKERAARVHAIRAIKAGWADHLEFLAIEAQMIRAKYLSLIKEGFTEAQALQLCK
jgi:hypothetical protein